MGKETKRLRHLHRQLQEADWRDRAVIYQELYQLSQRIDALEKRIRHIEEEGEGE